ncbi:hypothetical protein FVB32_01430 [Flagellimonas hymeniacidonis]|uniref:PKD domain-containing protein n=1 Tax=Flagellimonas hymeniacidonis TaxID=2603628 RepID=A0A5C8V6D8_9FLAO|nr:hypothetical protein [Flagellimonas hymeniacidonis]TXN36976.1 hypothetical protein FVB32_01430 [Flagellimonas hymeniacidonis]
MKRKVSLMFGLLFLILMSCEKEETVAENLEAIKSTSSIGSNGCEVNGNFNPISFSNEERIFTAVGLSGFSSVWTVESGNIQIIGSSVGSSVRLRFLSNFTTGSVMVKINNPGASTDCDVVLNLYKVGFDPNCPNTGPSAVPIFSQFGSPTPPGYQEGNLGSNSLCVNTIANRLSIPFDPCVSSYSWTINPSGINVADIFPEDNGNAATVIIKNAGNYTVTLVTSNANGTRIEVFGLNAVNCNSGGGF